MLVHTNHSDYYSQTNGIGYQIIIFNPFEYPDRLTGNYRLDILEPGDIMSLDVKPVYFESKAEIMRFPVKRVGL